MAFAVNGVNIAVKDLASATEKYEQLFGVTGEHVGEDGFAFPGLEGTKFVINGFILNLITSSEPTTSVSRFLDRNGEGMFLLSVKADDLDAGIEKLKGLGITPLLPESVRGGFGAVNFVHPRDMSGVQVELIELPGDADGNC